MARFATKAVSTVNVPNTVNLAGGQAFTMSSKLEFATALLTSLIGGIMPSVTRPNAWMPYLPSDR